MEIAKYFASLSIKIENKDVKTVDAFLNNIGKGLKDNTKSTGDLEKAVKKETKTTVDGLVQKEQKQKALNKQITVAAKNQKAWNKEFAYSLKMMTSKPLSKTALKNQQSVYDQLFGAVTPKAMIGATGANQRAWNTRFRQQVAGIASGGSGISRRAMQEQLNAAFGAVGSNPKIANLLSQRLGHLGGGKSDTLADMAAFYRNEDKIANLKAKVARDEEAATQRILALRRRELEREERTRKRMAELEARGVEKAKRAAEKAARAREAMGNAAERRRIGRINTFRGGVSAINMPIGLASLSLPAMAAAAPLALAYGAQRGAVVLGNEQAQRQAQRTQLDIASGVSDRAGRDAANRRFFALSNELGVEASSMVDPYSKFMKQMLTMGKTPEQGFDVYRNMSIATRGAGGGQYQMERQAFALQQILGLGYLRSEELNLQLSDANPSIKKYIREAYAGRTGDATGIGFQRALETKQVSVEDVLTAYRNAAVAGQGRVQEFASTVQADQARLANIQLEEQMARTLSEEVIPGMKEYVKSQAEVYEAMKPFRDIMYDAAAGVLSFSANVLKASAPYLEAAGKEIKSNPYLESAATNPLSYMPEFGLVGSAIKWGAVGYQAVTEGNKPPIQTQSGLDFLKASKQNFMGGQSSNQVNIQPGAIVINAPTGNAESLSETLMSAMKEKMIPMLTGQYSTAMQAFPNTGN